MLARIIFTRKSRLLGPLRWDERQTLNDELSSFCASQFLVFLIKLLISWRSFGKRDTTWTLFFCLHNLPHEYKRYEYECENNLVNSLLFPMQCKSTNKHVSKLSILPAVDLLSYTFPFFDLAYFRKTSLFLKKEKEMVYVPYFIWSDKFTGIQIGYKRNCRAVGITTHKKIYRMKFIFLRGEYEKQICTNKKLLLLLFSFLGFGLKSFFQGTPV